MSGAKRFCSDLRYQEPLENFEDEIMIDFMTDHQQIRISNAAQSKTFKMAEVFRFIRRTAKSIRKKPNERVLRWIQNTTTMVRELCTVYGFRKIAPAARDILEICFQFQFMDSKLVVELIQIMDTGDSCISYIDNLISIDQEEYISLMCRFSSFLLGHAKKQRETFQGKWFGENSHKSVVCCVLYENVQLVRILLKNGFCSTIASTHRNYWESAARRQSFQALCSYRRGLKEWCCRSDIRDAAKIVAVIETLLFNIFDTPKDETDLVHFYPANDKDLMEIQESVPLLFKAIPLPLSRIPTDLSNSICSKDGTFIELKYEEEDAPCSLKHLCRCAIRERLGEKFLLPEGIWELRLPSVIHRYLNLEAD